MTSPPRRNCSRTASASTRAESSSRSSRTIARSSPSRGAVTGTTQLRIASATNWLSPAVILRLVDAGDLGLDDRLGDHLSIFDLYGKGGVTLRQCFAMTSGLHETAVDYETSPWLTRTI